VRPFGPEDAVPLFEAVEESRPHLAPWLPWAHQHRTIDDARAFVRRAQALWLLREDLPVGVFERAGGRLLGGSGLHRIDWQLRSFEIGYWLRRSAEGHGYMIEAVGLLTRPAFEQLGANRVEIRMDPANVRSQHVAERAGYVHEGTLRRCAPGPNDVPTDRRVYALIPDDYRRLARAGGRQEVA
jgi:RimJ/RimL family protein N-acetyltransferase